VDLALWNGGSGITGWRAPQDKHGDFKFDTDAGVKGPEQRSASAADGPLLLGDGPSPPLALGAPALGLAAAPLRAPTVTDTVYQVSIACKITYTENRSGQLKHRCVEHRWRSPSACEQLVLP
jgi:hypothetical protein